MMYSTLNEFIDVGLLRQKTQSFENCSDYQESDRKLWSDKGTVRRYLAAYAGDASSAEVEHTYDENGMLRYVHISETLQDAINTSSVLEHQLYYDQEGTLLWHNKQHDSQNDAATEESKALETITFNPALAFDASHICD